MLETRSRSPRWVEGHHDRVTTGGSLLKAINAVEAAGLNVVQVLCVVDRCEGASEIFEAAGYTLEALVTRRHHLRCMMLSPEIHAERRAQLARTVDGPILLVGNGDRPRNLPMSTVAFRQDSSFLYFTGCTHAGAAVTLIDGRETLYLPVPAEDDALWHGVSHTIEELGAALGFECPDPAACSRPIQPPSTVSPPSPSPTSGRHSALPKSAVCLWSSGLATVTTV